ncbi:MAG: hypothetical protein AAF514_15190, partial [Verrucomicrobiota bacterium]
AFRVGWKGAPILKCGLQTAAERAVDALLVGYWVALTPVLRCYFLVKNVAVVALMMVAFAVGMAVDRLIVTRATAEYRGPHDAFSSQVSSSSPSLLDPNPGTLSGRVSIPADEPGNRNVSTGKLGTFSGPVTDLLSLTTQGAFGPDNEKMIQMLRTVNLVDLKRLAGSVGDLDRKDPRSRAVKRAVFEVLGEADPQTALEFASEERDRDMNDLLYRTAFKALASHDFAEARLAFERVKGFEDSSSKLRMVRAMADGVRAEDIAKMADLIREMPETGGFGSYFSRWVIRDPDAVFAYLDTMESGTLKGDWLLSTAHGLGRNDPDRAVAWIETLGNEVDRTKALDGAIQALGRTDPERAAQLFLTMSETGVRGGLSGSIAGHWAEIDVTAAREWAETLAAGSRQDAIRGMLQTWARTDPAAAAAYLKTQPPSEWSADVSRGLAFQWARQDVEAAAIWALESEDHRTRSRALDAIADQWGKKDPAQAVAFAGQIENQEQRQDFLGEVGKHWARSDLSAATEWVKTVDPEDRGHAARGVMDQVIDNDFEVALEMLSELTPDWGAEDFADHEFAEIGGRLASQWTRQQPENAAVWAASLPEGSDLQREAIEEVAEQWVETDSMAASQWISELPEGEIRDAGTERLVDRIAETDPASAWSWAMSASDADHRLEMREDVLDEWKEIDPGQARETLENALIPEERKAELFEELEED